MPGAAGFRFPGQPGQVTRCVTCSSCCAVRCGSFRGLTRFGAVGLAARPRRGPSSAPRVCQAARAAPLTVHETTANLQRLPRAGAPVAQLAARKAELAAAARAAAALGPLRAELDAARAELRALQRAPARARGAARRRRRQGGRRPAARGAGGSGRARAAAARGGCRAGRARGAAARAARRGGARPRACRTRGGSLPVAAAAPPQHDAALPLAAGSTQLALRLVGARAARACAGEAALRTPALFPIMRLE